MNKQTKVLMATMYKGSMPKDIRKDYCKPDQERAVMKEGK